MVRDINCAEPERAASSFLPPVADVFGEPGRDLGAGCEAEPPARLGHNVHDIQQRTANPLGGVSANDLTDESVSAMCLSTRTS